MKLTKLEKEIFNFADNYMNQQDFDRGKYSIRLEFIGDRKKTQKYVTITFALKGNKKIIDHFIINGWEKDRTYSNDGDPSIWSSDVHNKVVGNTRMIVLRYNLGET